MKFLRATFTVVFVPLLTCILLVLYASSWHFPQCLAAWKLDDSYMLATHRGSLWLTYQSNDFPHTPRPPSWTFRRFSAHREMSASGSPTSYSSGSLFSVPPNAFDAKRELLGNPPSALATHWSFHLLGFALGAESSTIVYGTFTPGAPTFTKTYLAVIPLWALCLPLLFLSFLAVRPFWLRRYRKRHNLCLACGYDLRETACRCPECGTPIPVAATSTPKRVPIFSGVFRRAAAFTATHPLLTGLTFLVVALLIVLLFPRPKPQVVYIEAATFPAMKPAGGSLVTVAYDQEPLEEVLKDLARQSKVDILPNWRAMESCGIPPHRPVTLQISKALSLDDALRYLIDTQFDSLAYVVDDNGIVHFSSQEGIEHIQITTRVYDIRFVHNLVERDPLAPRDHVYHHDFASLIRDVVKPTCWRENGGTSSLCIYHHYLIVTASADTHRKTASLLNEIRREGGLKSYDSSTIFIP